MRNASWKVGTLLVLTTVLGCGDGEQDGEVSVAHVEDPARKQQILGDTEVADRWYYDDLPGALAAASAEGRPVFLVFR